MSNDQARAEEKNRTELIHHDSMQEAIVLARY